MKASARHVARALLVAPALWWVVSAQSQVLPPWRVDTMGSRDVNDWLEFAQPTLPSRTEGPVDDTVFSALAKGGPWNPVDYEPLPGDLPRVFELARRADWRGVKEALDQSDVPVNLRDRDGATLLTLAARAGRLDALQELTRRGADIEQTGLYGLSPLGAAALGGHDLLVRELLRAGADVARWSAQGQPPLHLAARGGHVRVMQSLVAAGAEPMQFNREGRHALAEAARFGQIDAMSWLVNHAGMPIDVRDEAGLNATHAAALGRHAEALAWLKDHGATRQHALTAVLIERDPDPLPMP